MGLLEDGRSNDKVLKTTLTRKVTLDGLTSTYPVYKIKLDELFYNEQNDRIATWINKYKAQHDGKAPDIDNKEEFNWIIEQFIVESNPDAIKKTQLNIEMFEQREPGVVLNDGRIIDGNRRFTCLRRLAEKNEKFGYFEAVILDRRIENSAKQIKMLELTIQHGEEEKVDYNPVDRLVGVYNDIIDTKLLTIDEYARSTNEDISTVKKNIDVAQLMVEFLDFINAPKQFYIARDLQVNGPLYELAGLLKKCSTDNEKEDMKISAFTNILMQPAGDMTRYVRQLKQIAGTNYQAEFLEEQKDIASKVLDTLPAKGEMSTEKIRNVIRANEDAEERLECSMDKAVTKTKKDATRNRPAQLVEKASQLIEQIDTNIIMKMNNEEMSKFQKALNELEDAMENIRENL